MFGLRLDLKINVLALAAFLLSTGSLAWQAIEMWRGPRVEMAAGERINFLKRSHTAQPDMPYLVVNARLDYVNEGAVGRNTTIAAERLNLRFANWKPYEYRWLHFELIVSDAEGKPVVETRDGAHSVLVPGGSAASHQTTFVAFRDASVWIEGAKAAYVLWIDFMRFIRDREPIKLRFLARDRGGRSYVADCEIVVSSELQQALEANDWATAICEPDWSAGRLVPESAERGPARAPPPDW